MKVSLSPSFSPIKAEGTVTLGAPLLDPEGARVILGSDGGMLADPITPAAHRMFGPRGVCLHPDGSFWVADTGHHRLLGWRKLPDRDDQSADILFGQPAFGREGRNAKGPVTAATLNVPTGISAFRGGLAVADAWNHRVLIWHRLPEGPDSPADFVLGQADAGSALANRGADAPTAATLHWPYGLSEIDGRLVVCDTGNRRLLVWNDPVETGQPADLVLGQDSFTCRDENGGGPVAAGSMRWPHMASGWRRGLAVADAGNNRVMVWSGFPQANGQPADALVGQAGMTDCDLNRGAYYPSSLAVNMPYALGVLCDRLIVGDTANSRILGFSETGFAAEADRLTGQPDFASKGDNRWGLASRDSLCWPYGLSVRGSTVAVADSGNNRVLIWEAAT
ncbi:MAG: NHL repeat-containing protein [Pseudomonadota bacterium]